MQKFPLFHLLPKAAHLTPVQVGGPGEAKDEQRACLPAAQKKSFRLFTGSCHSGSAVVSGPDFVVLFERWSFFLTQACLEHTV